LPSVPQAAHTDFEYSAVDKAKHKPFIMFTAALTEGCMLLVWTKDLYIMANNLGIFCHFFIYIPYGSIVFLSSNTIHAGGFTFSQSSGKVNVFLYLQWKWM